MDMDKWIEEEILRIMLNDVSVKEKVYRVIIKRLYDENLKLKIELESGRNMRNPATKAMKELYSALDNDLNEFFGSDTHTAGEKLLKKLDEENKKSKRDNKGRFASDKEEATGE